MTPAQDAAFSTLRSVAAAAGLVTRFDAEGVLVIAIPDETPPADAQPAAPSAAS